MKINAYGTIITNITNIALSLMDNDSIAFQDSDGAVIHIKKSDIEKLHQFYVTSLGPIPRNNQEPTSFDSLFK